MLYIQRHCTSIHLLRCTVYRPIPPYIRMCCICIYSYLSTFRYAIYLHLPPYIKMCCTSISTHTTVHLGTLPSYTYLRTFRCAAYICTHTVPSHIEMRCLSPYIFTRYDQCISSYPSYIKWAVYPHISLFIRHAVHPHTYIPILYLIFVLIYSEVFNNFSL